MAKLTLDIEALDHASPVLKKVGAEVESAANKIKAPLQGVAQGAETYMTKAERATFRFTNAIENSASSIVSKFSPGAAQLFQVMDRVSDAGQRGGKSMAVLGGAIGGVALAVGFLAETFRSQAEEQEKFINFSADMARAVRSGDFGAAAAAATQAHAELDRAIARSGTNYQKFKDLGRQAFGLLTEAAEAYRMKQEAIISESTLRPLQQAIDRAKFGEAQARGFGQQVSAIEGLTGAEQGHLSELQITNFSNAQRIASNVAFREREKGLLAEFNRDKAKLEEEGRYAALKIREDQYRYELQLLQQAHETEKTAIAANQAEKLNALRKYNEQVRQFESGQAAQRLKNIQDAASLELDTIKASHEDFRALMDATGGGPAGIAAGLGSAGRAKIQADLDVQKAAIQERLDKELFAINEMLRGEDKIEQRREATRQAEANAQQERYNAIKRAEQAERELARVIRDDYIRAIDDAAKEVDTRLSESFDRIHAEGQREAAKSAGVESSGSIWQGGMSAIGGPSKMGNFTAIMEENARKEVERIKAENPNAKITPAEEKAIFDSVKFGSGTAQGLEQNIAARSQITGERQTAADFAKAQKAQAAVTFGPFTVNVIVDGKKVAESTVPHLEEAWKNGQMTVGGSGGGSGGAGPELKANPDADQSVYEGANI